MGAAASLGHVRRRRLNSSDAAVSLSGNVPPSRIPHGCAEIDCGRSDGTNAGQHTFGHACGRDHGPLNVASHDLPVHPFSYIAGHTRHHGQLARDRDRTRQCVFTCSPDVRTRSERSRSLSRVIQVLPGCELRGKRRSRWCHVLDNSSIVC